LSLSTARARGTVVVLIALALALLMPTATYADGDPASDVLLTEDVFLPYAPPVAPSLVAILTNTVVRAHAAGFPIKVALIESPQDLGALPTLYGHPQRYANFLDVEISYNSTAKLLVVMPQGFGRSAVGPSAALAAIHVDAAQRANGLARAAIRAVVALADRAGDQIPLPKLPGAGTPGGGIELPLIAVPVVLVLVLGGVAGARRRRSPTISKERAL